LKNQRLYAIMGQIFKGEYRMDEAKNISSQEAKNLISQAKQGYYKTLNKLIDISGKKDLNGTELLTFFNGVKENLKATSAEDEVGAKYTPESKNLLDALSHKHTYKSSERPLQLINCIMRMLSAVNTDDLPEKKDVELFTKFNEQVNEQIKNRMHHTSANEFNNISINKLIVCLQAEIVGKKFAATKDGRSDYTKFAFNGTLKFASRPDALPKLLNNVSSAMDVYTGAKDTFSKARKHERNEREKEDATHKKTDDKLSTPTPVSAPQQAVKKKVVYDHAVVSNLDFDELPNITYIKHINNAEPNPSHAGEDIRLKLFQRSLQGFDGVIDRNSPWQMDIANSVLGPDNLRQMKDLLLVKPVNGTGFDPAHIQKRSPLKQASGDERTGWDIICLIRKHRQQLGIAIDRDKLAEKIGTIIPGFSRLSAVDQEALAKLSDAKLRHNDEFYDHLKGPASVSLACAFGGKEIKTEVMKHIFTKSIAGKDISDKELTGITAKLFNQVQLA